MSRYSNYDDDSPEAVLAYGRWKVNARRALKGKRGRQALRDLREALLALPEPKLISSALCTVGGSSRVPDVTEAEIAAVAAMYEAGGIVPDRERITHYQQEDRQEQRDRLASVVQSAGEGVCAIGAYAWHQKVKAGMDPAEAFAALPTIVDGQDDGDPLQRTAEAGEDAGMTFTLAWELAYRNDETYEAMTPEERWTAFLAWIDQELAAGEPQPAGAAS